MKTEITSWIFHADAFYEKVKTMFHCYILVGFEYCIISGMICSGGGFPKMNYVFDIIIFNLVNNVLQDDYVR